MADYLSPSPTGQGTRRGYAFGVMVAGASLVFCAILPWAGVEARSELIGGGVSDDIRGVDDVLGVLALLAGLAALGCGVAGVLTRPRVAALASLPGALAALVLVLFVTDSAGIRDRISIDLGRLLSVEPVIRFGWFAALASALAVVVLAVATLVRRQPWQADRRGGRQS
ncbi:hypothetical protein ACIBQX_27700 [Nonomuraea sp. NPDC049714]|uniref:hypothetical protein n=1 Tax=Nonomuraea sp. NPDC049714 TaxID=3364357 RepID=UPI0037981CCF